MPGHTEMLIKLYGEDATYKTYSTHLRCLSDYNVYHGNTYEGKVHTHVGVQNILGSSLEKAYDTRHRLWPDVYLTYADVPYTAIAAMQNFDGGVDLYESRSA